MASLQLEGALEGVSEKQQQFIREVLEKRGFTNNKVLFEPAGKVGDNYVANVKRITVKVEGGDDFKMIAKIATQLESLRTVMSTNIMFNNEIIMYEQFLPKINSLQVEAGVPEKDRLKFAQCYGCLSEEPHELVLLEDLKVLGYAMLDRLSTMNEDAVLLVLKNFAILHSMSYVLKHLEPETYTSFSSRLIQMWSIVFNKPEQRAFMEQVENGALEVLDDENYKKAIRGVVSQTHTFADKIKKHENPKYLAIQQGDAWTNNLMFKLNGDTPVDSIMIDYQVSSETSPVADILYFIFTCTDHATRSKQYLKWIDYYHEQLDKSLSNFGLKANFVYPKEYLDADLKRYSKSFFGVVIMLNTMLTRNPEEAAQMHDALTNFDEEKMGEMGVQTLSGDTISKYKQKLHDLIDSYRQFGYMS
ncbi:hypothetical protein ABMA28_003192 [Loxostege sticticalis]|uniref:CHK kinase-like domain-containing protein n=1 Tax=Loxostege sticticalis TaxID=481309 RepID=A0ABD0SVA9_LOXSC